MFLTIYHVISKKLKKEAAKEPATYECFHTTKICPITRSKYMIQIISE